MLKDNIISEEKRLNNIYTVLRMSILLGKSENILEEKKNLEEVITKLDKIKQNEYDSKIGELINPSETLESEKKRLSELVKLISVRLKDREDLSEDFKTVVGNNISLEEISYADKLDKFENRLHDITKYLETTQSIVTLKEELSIFNNQLTDEYEQKVDNEKNNNTFISKFIRQIELILSEQFIKIDVKEIEVEYEKAKKDFLDKEKSYNTLNKAYESLLSSGIDQVEQREYNTFVISSEEDYIKAREKYELLNMYSLLINGSIEYEAMLSLYENISESNKNLSECTKRDYLIKIDKLVNEEKDLLDIQKKNVLNINKLQNKILFKERILKNSEKEINKDSIRVILKEYKIIEDPIEDVSNTPELVIEKQSVKEKEPNTIVNIKDYNNSNLNSVKEKCMKVLTKVCDTLNPKPIKEEEIIIERPISKDINKPVEEPIKIEEDKELVQNIVPEMPKVESSVINNEVLASHLEDNSNTFSFDDVMPEIPQTNEKSEFKPIEASVIENDLFFPELEEPKSRRLSA